MTAATGASRTGDPVLDDVITRGVQEIIPEQEFIEALKSGRKLRLKLGLDPSKPDLHIGHAVLLRKLRKLQDRGHQVVLIVGDWTAQIGDPSGQSIMRPMLTAEEVRANAETYMRQFFHIVDRERTEVRWQSEWYDRFTLADVIRLAAKFTVAQFLQREDFRERFQAGKPLGIHELLYPLLQAYDSVAVQADVEFGGSDQRFNLLVGRELQEAMGQRPQFVFIMDLLVGIDGKVKMSKSVSNTVDLEDPPLEKYGKIMSIPDDVIMDYFTLATDVPREELQVIARQLAERRVNPMELKKRLAREIVTMFDGPEAAREAEEAWTATFQERHLPETGVPEYHLGARSREAHLVDLLVEARLAPSKSEARRLLHQRAIEIDGAVVEAPVVELRAGSVIRVGKHRFLKVVE
jgi:tyrosyl-tRNA synthetase